ncbi:uncharacterized protein [Haliotis asinina]|uniref:uncharacterized protein n=1 Tax=Haliotis asinina TaxID=109174 RepID=UPI0035321910
MATTQKITDNFLTCTMCTEVSGDPSTLECNHTVCQKCVIDSTKTRPEAISEKLQLCPKCNEMTKVSDSDRPAEVWAVDIMTSSIIHRQLDSDKESENITYCRYCTEEGEINPASCWCSVCDDALCERCVRMHNRNPSSRHHDVLDIPRELKAKKKGKVLCADHNDEDVTPISRDCKKSVCQTRRITLHEKCERVVETESEIPAMKSALTRKQKQLLKKREKMQILVHTQKNAVNEESERCLQIELGIKSATKKAVDMLKRKEKNLLNDLKNASDKNAEQLKAAIESGEMAIQVYQQQAELIDQALQSECDLDVYDMYQGYDAGDVDDTEDEDLRIRVARIKFTQDVYKLSQTLDDLQLGGIDVMYESVLDMKATPVLQDTVNVRIGDAVEADPIDVTVLLVNGIDTVVVTDYENKSMKSFYTKDTQKCHSRLFLGQVGRPWCMAKIKHNQLAVTVLGISQIVTVEVNPELLLLSTITTRKQYYGITSLTPSTLAAGSHSPPCVDILDVTGQVLSSISPLVNGYPVFKFPNFLFTTWAGDILVSDSGSRYVVCLTSKGDVVFTYSSSGNTSLKYPRGLASTISGDILVADSFLHRVIHLNNSGEFVRNIMTSQDGIHYPWGMTAFQRAAECVLACTICTEMFENPCTLMCNHTFCRKCIVSYTKSRPEVISAKSLPCPLCLRLTKVTNPDRPVVEWADDLPPSDDIQGLLASVGPVSRLDITYCRYCKEEGDATPATSWCSVCDDALCDRCVRMHNRNSSARHHDVVGISEEMKFRRKRRVMCTDHKDEEIKLMCKDCKKAVCQTCCIIYHRHCRCVVELEKEMPAMKSELTKKKHHLMKRCSEMKNLVGKQATKIKEESTHYFEKESDIKSATNRAIDLLKQKEKNLLNELKEMTDEVIGELKAELRSREMLVQMYQQQTELIDQALQSECGLDVYEIYQGYDAGDVEDVLDTDPKETRRGSKIMLRQNAGKRRMAVGEINVQSVLDMKATLVLQNTIDVIVAGDREVIPVDVTVLVVNGTDTVVVTDFKHKRVKSSYTRINKVCHSKLSLGSRPCGLTKLKHNQVAVTLPDTRQIVTVGVNPDLELLSSTTTSKQYRGITSLTPSILAAGSSSPPGVDILDVTGHVMRSIKPVHNGYSMLQNPSYLCTSREGNILVSDWESKCVVCLTPGGDVVFTYSPIGATALGRPVGITTTSTGDILVVDYSLDRVIHLTESGMFVRTILTSRDGIQYPSGLCLDGRGYMYVCMSNVVKVFSP